VTTAEESSSLYYLLAELASDANEAGRTQETRAVETTDEAGIFVPLPHY
jgi:hypothetical protein